MRRPLTLEAALLALLVGAPLSAAPDPERPPVRSWSRMAAETWLARAAALAARGETASAITSYTRALESDPTLGRAYLGLAELRRLQGDARETEWLLTRAVAISEVRAEALARRADFYESTGRVQQALVDWRTAAEFDPSPTHLRKLAEKYVGRRAWVAALAVWRKLRVALEHAPEAERMHAEEMIAALATLASEADAVQHDTGEGNWIRRALRRHALH